MEESAWKEGIKRQEDGRVVKEEAKVRKEWVGGLGEGRRRRTEGVEGGRKVKG